MVMELLVLSSVEEALWGSLCKVQALPGKRVETTQGDGLSLGAWIAFAAVLLVTFYALNATLRGRLPTAGSALSEDASVLAIIGLVAFLQEQLLKALSKSSAADCASPVKRLVKVGCAARSYGAQLLCRLSPRRHIQRRRLYLHLIFEAINRKLQDPVVLATTIGSEASECCKNGPQRQHRRYGQWDFHEAPRAAFLLPPDVVACRWDPCICEQMVQLLLDCEGYTGQVFETVPEDEVLAFEEESEE